MHGAKIKITQLSFSAEIKEKESYSCTIRLSLHVRVQGEL
jgi:hypothetical protein